MVGAVRKPEDVPAFVEHLLDPERALPVVALTSRVGDQDPAFEPGEVRARLGDELDLFVIPTGKRTFELGDAIGKELGVFGGAARIWWPGFTTSDRPLDHPLIFDRHGVYGSQMLDRLVAAFEKGRLSTPLAMAPDGELLTRRAEGLEQANERLLQQLAAANDQVEELGARVKAAEERARTAEKSLRAEQSASSEPDETEARGDDRFYTAILEAWLRDNPSAHDRSTTPLRPFVLGPAFAKSVAGLGIELRRVARVCAWVLDGRAEKLRSLAVHKLRTGSGGEDPQRVRADGAAAWRVNLKVNTPGAPRLHYWVRRDHVVEFASVNHHDDLAVPE